MWNLENGIHTFTCKAEMETQTQGTDIQIPSRKVCRAWDELGGWDGHIYTITHELDN